MNYLYYPLRIFVFQTRILTFDSCMAATLTEHVDRTRNKQIDILASEWLHAIVCKVSHTHFCLTSGASKKNQINQNKSKMP